MSPTKFSIVFVYMQFVCVLETESIGNCEF